MKEIIKKWGNSAALRLPSSVMELAQLTLGEEFSEEDWSAIQETSYLLAIPGMRESIKDAMAQPLE